MEVESPLSAKLARDIRRTFVRTLAQAFTWDDISTYVGHTLRYVQSLIDEEDASLFMPYVAEGGSTAELSFELLVLDEVCNTTLKSAEHTLSDILVRGAYEEPERLEELIAATERSVAAAKHKLAQMKGT